MDPDAVDDVEHVPHGGATDPDVLDFSANVNPERPAGTERVHREALRAAGRYPDDDYPDFRAAAADAVDCHAEGVAPDHAGADRVAPDHVLPTTGGLGAIRLAVAVTVASGDEVLVPAPGFREYAREVRLQGGSSRFVPHDDLLAADPADAAMAVVCQPNNPTGTAYDVEDLRAFAARCRETDTVLLVDEAFLGFSDRPSVAGEAGVVVARSLTKLYGLPGLRAGYAVARGDLRDRLATARQPWTLGAPAAAVGTHCLSDRAFVRETRRRVRRERARLRDALSGAYDVHSSEAPFLLLDVGDRDTDALLDRARAAGVAVRDARDFRGFDGRGRLDGHVRVAVRLPAENDRLLAALDVA